VHRTKVDAQKQAIYIFTTQQNRVGMTVHQSNTQILHRKILRGEKLAIYVYEDCSIFYWNSVISLGQVEAMGLDVAVFQVSHKNQMIKHTTYISQSGKAYTHSKLQVQVLLV